MSSVIKTFPRKYCNYAGREWNLPAVVHSILIGTKRDVLSHSSPIEFRAFSYHPLPGQLNFRPTSDGVTLLIAVRYENCIKCENEVAITFDERDVRQPSLSLIVKDCSISVKFAHF